MAAKRHIHAYILSLFVPLPALYCQFIDVLLAFSFFFSCRPLFVSGVCCYGCCLPMQGPEDPTLHPLTTGSQHSSSVLPLAGPRSPLCFFFFLLFTYSLTPFFPHTLSCVSLLLMCSSCAVLHKLSCSLKSVCAANLCCEYTGKQSD